MQISSNKVNSLDGIIVIQGTIYNYDKSKTVRFNDALKNYDNQDLMVVSFNDSERFNVNEFKGVIGDFIREHNDVIIILAVHGAQPVAFLPHYSFLGKISFPVLEAYSWRLHAAVEFFKKDCIQTADIIKAIGEAAGEKPINLWHYTCQAGKLAADAQKYLPPHSSYVAEGEGFYAPNYFLETFIQVMEQNQPFSFEILYQEYLNIIAKGVCEVTKVDNYVIHQCHHSRVSYQECEEAKILNDTRGNCNHSLLKTDPIKITIGDGVVRAYELADRLIDEIRIDNINLSLLSSVVNSTKAFEKKAEEIVEIIQSSSSELTLGNCISSLNKSSWVYRELYRLFDKDSPSNCLEDEIYQNFEGMNRYNIVERFALLAHHYYDSLPIVGEGVGNCLVESSA